MSKGKKSDEEVKKKQRRRLPQKEILCSLEIMSEFKCLAGRNTEGLSFHFDPLHPKVKG
jgi:hypothetical protein